MLRRGDIVLVHYGFTNLATILTDRVDRVIGLCQRNRCRRSTRAFGKNAIHKRCPKLEEGGRDRMLRVPTANVAANQPCANAAASLHYSCGVSVVIGL